MRPTELRIKLAHIGMEPGIIRKHERRIKDKIQRLKDRQANTGIEQSYAELRKLQLHRRWDVRNEARATHLALGLLSGQRYSEMERNCDVGKRDAYIIPRVLTMVKKYGQDPSVTRGQVEAWLLT